jgi:uncharacterized coiled-coil protein SlyX
MPPRASPTFDAQLIRSTAAEFPQAKSLELETRVARLEILMKDMCAAYDELHRRMVAIQAQLDHIAARLIRL